jgi:hypothetical protein
VLEPNAKGRRWHIQLNQQALLAEGQQGRRRFERRHDVVELRGRGQLMNDPTTMPGRCGHSGASGRSRSSASSLGSEEDALATSTLTTPHRILASFQSSSPDVSAAAARQAVSGA